MCVMTKRREDTHPMPFLYVTYGAEVRKLSNSIRGYHREPKWLVTAEGSVAGLMVQYALPTFCSYRGQGFHPMWHTQIHAYPSNPLPRQSTLEEAVSEFWPVVAALETSSDLWLALSRL